MRPQKNLHMALVTKKDCLKCDNTLQQTSQKAPAIHAGESQNW